MVIFVNKLTLLGPVDQFERNFTSVADFMLTQPGILRFVLAKSQKDANVYFIVAEWTDAESFDRAVHHEGFRSRYAAVKPLITGDPHLADVTTAGSPQESLR